jgi:hypothetical protein
MFEIAILGLVEPFVGLRDGPDKHQQDPERQQGDR